MELQLSPTQKVPWHSHTNITDTFYVLEGHMRLFLQDPKEEVNLKPGEIHVVGAARPHLVTNGGTKSLTVTLIAAVVAANQRNNDDCIFFALVRIDSFNSY
jgi:quercetin dioxygenase-like cupin family protein